MNVPVIVFSVIAALALVVFLVVRNQKDKKELVNKLNNDYRKSKDEEKDEDPEEMVR